MKASFVFLLFCLFTLASCVDCDEPTPDCVAISDPACYCIEVYDPVCGCNGITYSNACHAECASILEYTPGPCGGEE